MTGSGKTGAFVLPIIQQIFKKPQPSFALVLSPTRELAIQIMEQFITLGSKIGISCSSIIGGLNHIQQIIELAKRPHIIIGSPGRVINHLCDKRGFNSQELRQCILDEADRLLDMEFEKEINQILRDIHAKRGIHLFSATLTNKIQKLLRLCLVDPVKVELLHKYQTVINLRQQFLLTPFKHKDCFLTFLLSELVGSTIMIFIRTRHSTRRVTVILNQIGYNVIFINGQMAQMKRLAILQSFKTKKSSILVATDMASRGLDITAVDLIINYDIPVNSKIYVHRVGRTARAGRFGRAVTFITQYDVRFFQKIEQLIGKKMDVYLYVEDTIISIIEQIYEAQRLALFELNYNARARQLK